jgi:hypothetical protein
MRDAATVRDGDRLASYIDFPRLRASLREQLTDRVESAVPAPLYDAFVKRRAGRIIKPIIDAIVSPESLKVALDVAPKSSGSSDRTRQTCGVDRNRLDHFRVRCARLPGGQADLEFERRGFGWRLVGIDLPENYGARIP